MEEGGGGAGREGGGVNKFLAPERGGGLIRERRGLILKGGL